MHKKIGVALINLGTPDSTKVRDVKRYLLEFLLDKRVINLPWLQRNFLVKALIVPRRKRHSANLYKQLPKLSDLPLRHFGNQVVSSLQKKMGDVVDVKLAMRYGNPSLKKLVDEWKEQNFDKIVIVPMFPQYASATTGSILEQFFSLIKSWDVIPKLHIIRDFYSHPAFIKAHSTIASSFDFSQFDHILFSYHGLPLKQLQSSNIIGSVCRGNTACCTPLNGNNKHCYRAQCLETTRLLMEEMGLKQDQVSTAFQSRLGKSQWLEPYAEDVIKKLAYQGKKKVLVFSPSFVSDCLETWVEIQTEYAELFVKSGGEKLELGPSLNSEPQWIDAIYEIIMDEVALPIVSS